ncbi:hypothetical protein KAX97_13755, partial [candidate division WOR-3 bacterium]|nr:hypothetical protein [candidate division WOR-3 bacterium]
VGPNKEQVIETLIIPAKIEEINGLQRDQKFFLWMCQKASRCLSKGIDCYSKIKIEEKKKNLILVINITEYKHKQRVR